MNVLDKQSIELHISVVGWLHIVNSVVNLLIAAFVIALLVGIGMITEDPTAYGIMATTGWLTGGLLAVLALPGLIVGIGLLNRAQWARVLAIVLAIFLLFLFPVGTLLGAYTLFVLLQRSAEVAFGCCVPEGGSIQAAAA